MALKDVNCERTDNVPYVSIIEITTTGRKASSTTDGVGQSVPIDSGEHRHCDITAMKSNDCSTTRGLPRLAKIIFPGKHAYRNKEHVGVRFLISKSLKSSTLSQIAGTCATRKF